MSSGDFVFELPGDLAPTGWVRVSGGGLRQPVEVRVEGGEVVALRLDNGEPIRSADLRSVRLPVLAEQLAAFVRMQITELEQDESASDHLSVRPGFAEAPERYWTEHEQRLMELYEAFAHREALTAWASDTVGAVGEFSSRGRGAAPPTTEEYERFMAIYNDELRREPVRGAKARTAARVGMNKSTVYRWIEQARERGIGGPS